MKQIEKAYEPSKFEDNIYKSWEENGYFKPEINMNENPSYDQAKDGKPFVIMMPPPNITGKLHIGHALEKSLQDILTRYHRLLGEPSLWLPGMDHAGIATQTVVDKALRKKGINKNEIGREKFVEEVWKWKEEFGDIILEQTKKMGASCDWSRERFTLDEGLSEAVREAFVNLYDKGLIYQGKYIVNWCPRCQTAIADDEVEHCEQHAKLYYFKYDKDFPITIATTRPETKFGDTGVAVNPNDKRYKEYIGKEFEVNLDGVKRKIKVFGDRSIDSNFGTGAVGVTPAHSIVDWKMAEANDLPVINVIDEYGKMTEEAGGKYKGLKAKEAGDKLVEYLKENNLLEKEQNYQNNLSICYRCNTAIEPLPSRQWFVKMKPLAEKAIKVVKENKIDIMPSQFEKIYFHWMENIRDWCISRQLWWGHRIPVWKKDIPKYSDLSKMIADKKLTEVGMGDSPVDKKTGEEYRIIAQKEDIEWFEKNAKFDHQYSYVDFFDGKKRTRVGEDAYTITDKESPKTGLVVKKGKSAAYNDNKVVLEERSTSGYCRYEIEFKNVLPEQFKERVVISSTEILEHAVDQEIGESTFVSRFDPLFDGWKQDPDVLDTWFSSALWPFSTLGWPKQTKDLQYFFPTTVLETGKDILFFWVARMIMMSLELTGEIPFKTVYLHGVVRDEQNRKMSKSLGNALDPLDIIPKYGTDALRMALVVGSTPGQDMAVGESKIKGYRNFTNKIWNASRFVMLRVSGGDLQTGEIGGYKIDDLNIDEKVLTKADEEVLRCHTEVIKNTTKYLNEYKISLAGELLYDYFWHTFCDIYIEQSKAQLEDDKTKDNTKKILIKILSESLTLLHPFIPFVTEAVWQELKNIYPSLPESAIISKWPK